jgi:hypothetical protein
MNIHDAQRPQGPAREAQIDLTRPNREAIAKAVEVQTERKAPAERPATQDRPAAQDKLELSTASRLLLQRAESGAATESEKHAARLAELKQRYVEGRLNTAERVERAAGKLLAGE